MPTNKRPAKEKEYADKGDRLIITGGAYADSDFKRAYVDNSRGYSDKKCSVVLTYPGSKNYFFTQLGKASVIAREPMMGIHAACDHLLMSREKEARKIIKGMGNVARLMAKYAKGVSFSNEDVGEIIHHVFFNMYVEYREYLGDSDQDENSEYAGVADDSGETIVV